MEMFALISYAVGGIVFLILSLFSHQKLNKVSHGTALTFACLFTALWCFLSTAHVVNDWISISESLRNGSWFIFLLTILFPDEQALKGKKLLVHTPWLIVLFISAFELLSQTAPSLSFLSPSLYSDNTIAISQWGAIFTAIIGLILVEQAYKNTDKHILTSIRYLYFGALGIFAYDLYSYVWSFMFKEHDPTHWHSRSIITLLTSILFFIGINQGYPQKQQFSISRRVVFYSTSLVITGAFLLSLSVGGYYIKVAGGTWGSLLQSVFVFSLCAFLAVLASSSKARAYVKVVVSKHLFRHKYDYREEWLRLIGTMTEMPEAPHKDRNKEQSDKSTNIQRQSIKAFCQIFNCQSGALWMLHDQRTYIPACQKNMEVSEDAEIPQLAPLVSFFNNEKRILLINELKQEPENYSHTVLPECIEQQNFWAVIPLFHQNTLIGFIALSPPEGDGKLNWEDFDLLKTAGLQIANFLAAEKTSKQLGEAKQFDAYSKLTAFIMHDLKNLIAQQSLVVKNAAKHKDNPAFIEDAIDTIDNSVKRMSALLDQLRQDHEIEKPKAIELNQVLVDAVKKCHSKEPRPSITLPKTPYFINSSAEQLSMIIGHVIRNAQDATAVDGFIDVILQKNGEFAEIIVEDNGSGMSPEFIRDRLFKPFDTTKDSKGMGIGAYQVREFIRQTGGDVAVESELEQGSRFTITIPLQNEAVENTPAPA